MPFEIGSVGWALGVEEGDPAAAGRASRLDPRGGTFEFLMTRAPRCPSTRGGGFLIPGPDSAYMSITSGVCAPLVVAFAYSRYSPLSIPQLTFSVGVTGSTCNNTSA